MSEIAKAEAGWTRERIELVKRSVCPKGISDDEFALFISQCQRSGLDPLLKEAFCVPRRVNTGTRERPAWGTKHEFQPSEAGMLARAERFPDFEGVSAAAVYAEDLIEMDAGAGTVAHRFNPAKRKGSLQGAWARVQRKGKVPVLVWCDFAGYVQQTPLWAKIPTTMIEKCARVAALRKAYPEAFGGLYIREEMPAEDFVDAKPAEPERPALPAPSPVRQQTRIQEAPPDDAQLEAIPVAVMKEAQAKADKVLGRAPVLCGFGPHKGRPLSEMGYGELEESLSLAREKLAEQPKAKWAKAMSENMAAIEEEVDARDAVTLGETGAQG